MELEKGQIVASRAGRDVTKLYVVLSQQQGRVLLANGAKHTLLQPKRKNVRHISPTGTVLAGNDMQTDTQLKQALAAYENNRGTHKQGG